MSWNSTIQPGDAVKLTAIQTETMSPENTGIQHLAQVLHDHSARLLSSASAHAFHNAVCDVLWAHVDEIGFLEGRIFNDLPAYMKIRCRTIALCPFFEVIKCEYLPKNWQSNSVWWDTLQLEVSRIAGLQNDLIGLERDLENGEQLNAVIILMRSQCGSLSKHGYESETAFSQCISQISAEHNNSIARCLDKISELHEVSGVTELDAVTEVVQHITTLGETHLKWCASSKRYHIKHDY